MTRPSKDDDCRARVQDKGIDVVPHVISDEGTPDVLQVAFDAGQR